MKQHRWTTVPILLFLVILLTLSIPSTLPAQAQDEGPPLDDEFVTALVMMSVNHNMMQGRNEVRDLSALSQFVDEYYAGLAAAAPDENARFSINFKRSALMSQIQDRINVTTGRNAFQTILDIMSDDSDTSPSPDDARRIVGGEMVPLTGDYFSVVNSRTMTSFEDSMSLLIDLSTAITLPSMAPTIADNSSWTYTPAAISSISSSISPGNGSSSGSSPSDGSSSSGDSSIGDSTAGGGDAPASTCPDPKPLRFNNTGFETVTVRVETYQPAPGCSAATPSASTVVSPDSSSSSYLELPPGSYTFCYEWQLDEDYNNDDMYDYHHRTTSSYTLSENSSSSPGSAATVTISPDSTVSNPNGRCGETLPAGPDTNTSGLTPEEAANQGTHTYLPSCTGDDFWCDGDHETITLNLNFSASSLTIGIPREGDTQVFTRLGPNHFSWANIDGDIFLTTFTMDGFSYGMDEYGIIVSFTLLD